MWCQPKTLRRESADGKIGRTDKEKLQMYYDGGLIEKNCRHGVLYALRIRKVTSFSLEKEMYLYLTETMA